MDLDLTAFPENLHNVFNNNVYHHLNEMVNYSPYPSSYTLYSLYSKPNFIRGYYFHLFDNFYNFNLYFYIKNLEFSNVRKTEEELNNLLNNFQGNLCSFGICFIIVNLTI